MKKIPLVLGLDDPAPLVHVYREHRAGGVILDSGEELVPSIPNSFLNEFCDLVEEFQIRGKFSVVPMPGGRGDIINGIPGFDKAEIDEWIQTVRNRLSPYFDFSPEMLTHNKALNLADGTFFPEREFNWADSQTYETLKPYVALALSILRDAGLTPTGATLPWGYSAKSDPQYAAAICDAFDETLGKKASWYFSGNAQGVPGYRPQIRYRNADHCIVQVHKTCSDYPWHTIECSRTDEAFISELADRYITADGQAGEIVDAIRNNSCAIICTHWQALYSNGRKTGLAVLRETARRVREHYADKIEWQTFSDLMDAALAGESA